MKKLVQLSLALALLLGAYSCTDENIGSSLNDTAASIISDSSFTMTGYAVPYTHVISRARSAVSSSASSSGSSTSDNNMIMQLLGKVRSSGYGNLTSDVVAQFMPASRIDTAGTGIDSLHTCRLVLTVPRNAITGDTITPMRVRVYKLNKQLPDPIYSDFDPTGYYSESDLLGEASYTTTMLDKTSTASASYRFIYVPMPLSLAKDIYQLYLDHPETLKSPEAFAQYFPGVYITNSYGSGRVMNVCGIEIETLYKKHVVGQQMSITGSTVIDIDSINPAAAMSYMSATPEVISNSNVNLEVDDNVKQMVDNGDAVLQGPAGYEVKVKFPAQEIIDMYKREAAGNLAVINAVQMEIPVETIENTYGIKPPRYLLMVKSSHKDKFFEEDSTTNNTTSFYATLDTVNNVYTFGGLRNYILNIINNENGIASDDDCDITVTPVDMQFYTTEQSYYTTATTTYITHISPMMSSPYLGRLRLDKAKIKLVASRQSPL